MKATLLSWHKHLLMTLTLCILGATSAFSQDYYRTKNSGDWENASTWESSPDDVTYSDASQAPNGTNAILTTVQSGHTVSVQNGVTVTGTNIIVDGTLNVLSGGTLTVAHSADADIDLDVTGDMTVSGLLIGADLADYNSTASDISFASGSVYRHMYTTSAGALPTATWNINSTVEFKGFTSGLSASSTSFSQTLGNVLFDCTLASGAAVNFAGRLNNIAGNLTVSNTGAANNSSRMTLNASTGSITVAIGGNVTVTNSAILNIANTASGMVLNIGGDYIITSTNTVGSQTLGTTGNNLTINVGDDFSIGNSAKLIMAGSSATLTGTTTINVAGDFTNTGTIFGSASATSPQKGVFQFNGGGTVQNIVGTGSFFNTINYVVLANAVIDIPQGNFLSGTGPAGNLSSFTANANSTVRIGSVSGIDAGTASGNIRVSGTRTFNGRLIYNGVSEQVLGTGFPSTAVDLNINNSTTVTLSGTTTINTLTLTLGGLLVSGNTLNIQLDPVVTSGNLSGGSGTVNYTGSVGQSIISSTYNNLGLSGTGAKTAPTTLTVNGNFTNSSTVSGGTTWTIAGSVTNSGTITAPSVMNIGGDFTNNGTFTHNNGAVRFNGSSNATTQSVGGSSTTNFYDLRISNTGTAGVTLTGPANLINVLYFPVSTSRFITTGQTFTLKSTASATASMSSLTTGATVTGNFVVERFIPGGSSGGYVLIGPPVTGQTGSNFSDDSGEKMLACPTGCADGAAGSFVSLYSYSESTGTFTAGNDATALTPGTGYWLYLINSNNSQVDDFTMKMTGPPKTGVTPLPVSRNTDGFSLVANPYPSVIDWDDADWTKSNIDDAIYVWNDDIGAYASYTGGASPASSPAVGSGGINNLIPPYQGFYVEATNASATLTANEGIKSTGNPTFRSAGSGTLFRVYCDGNGKHAETAVRILDGATTGYDRGMDAKFLSSTKAGVVNMNTEMGGIKYSINSVAAITNGSYIPLRIKPSVTGTYTISVTDLSDIPAGQCVILKDMYTGAEIDLKQTPSYTCVIKDTTSQARFRIMGCNVVTPTNLRTTDIQNVSATARWNRVIGATGYKVRIKKANAVNWTSTYTTANTFKNFNNLLANTAYVWDIRAMFDTVSSAASSPVQFTTISSACIAPSNPVVSSTTATTADISWSESAGSNEDHYSIVVKKATDTQWPTTPTMTTSATSATLTGLLAGTTYNWKVRTACDASGAAASAFLDGPVFTTSGQKMTSLEEIDGEVVSIYPNPAKGQITIELGKTIGELTITVISINGQELIREEISGVNNHKINLELLNAGIYFVKLQSEGNSVMKRINVIK